MKELKELYLKNGIHIYDINLNGNYGNGNSTGTVTYKVRKNDNVQAFDKKLSDVNKKAHDQFRGNIKNTTVKMNKKPM